MDGFSLVQQFFTRMRCNSCDAYLEADGIELVRHSEGMYVVNVHCVHCQQSMGMALVGVESEKKQLSGNKVESTPVFDDPELTPQELQRLSHYNVVDYDDVLNAHRFFSTLGADWMRHLPPEMLEPETDIEPESRAS